MADQQQVRKLKRQLIKKPQPPPDTLQKFPLLKSIPQPPPEPLLVKKTQLSLEPLHLSSQKPLLMIKPPEPLQSKQQPKAQQGPLLKVKPPLSPVPLQPNQQPKTPNKKLHLKPQQNTQPQLFYGVRKGKNPGVYTNLQECEEQTAGFPNHEFQCFHSKSAAWEYVTGQCMTPQHHPLCAYASGERQIHGKKGVAGVGVYFGPFHPLNVSQRLPGDHHTINSSKILAAAKAVQLIRNSGWNVGTIYSDSTYVVNGITKWVQKWKTNGWKTSTGADAKNRVEFEELDQVVSGLNVTWVYVTGENLPMGSREAQKLALAGLKLEPNS